MAKKKTEQAENQSVGTTDFLSIYQKFKKGMTDPASRKYLTTGHSVIDTLLSEGKGLPLGCYIELSSSSGCGKTTLVLDIARHLCEQGQRTLYIDVETGLSENLLKKIGLMPYYNDLFMVLNPTTFNALGEILDDAVKEPSIKLIVIDSVTALTPDELTEYGRKISDGQIGIQSRYTGNLLKRYRERINNNEKTMIFINQMRTKIPSGYGHAYDAPAGGNAQQFTMDIRLMMKCVEKINAQDKHQIGAINEIWAIKNRHGEPFKKYNVKLMFGKGIDELQEYAQWLIDNGVADKRGGGNFTVTWHGKEIKFKGQIFYEEWINDNAEEIKKFIDDNGGLVPVASESSEGEYEEDSQEDIGF